MSLYPDDRGYFLEILRTGQGLVSDFGAKTMQASAAYNYPGAIKAFHYHLRQTDVFTPVMGLLQIALVDLRQGSPTFGQRNTIYSGPLRLWQILIPPGVGHGYKVLGRGAVPAGLCDRSLLRPPGRRPYPLQPSGHQLRLGPPAQIRKNGDSNKFPLFQRTTK